MDLQTAEEFIDASEKAHPMTTVIIHLYEKVSVILSDSFAHTCLSSFNHINQSMKINSLLIQ